jgi:hypothetical protein
MSTPRSLAPKEHGAYAQLALPLLAALASGKPTLASVLLVVASFAVFAAHEPLIVLIGRRGKRAAREDGGRATKLLVTLVAIAIGSTAWAIARSGPQVMAAGGVPLLLAPVIAIVIARGSEKTLLGEIGAAATLSACSIPVAIASSVAPPVALMAWGSWLVAFASATFAVRGVIAHRKKAQQPFTRALSVLIAPVFAFVVAISFGSYAFVVAATPVVIASLFLALSPPHPRSLARVGWALVVASLATTALVVREARVDGVTASTSQ